MYTFQAVNGETVAYSLELVPSAENSSDSFSYYQVYKDDFEAIGIIRFALKAKERQWSVPSINPNFNLNKREQAVKMVFYNVYPKLMET